MKVPKELAPRDVLWKELASLELFPFHSDRIRVAIDKGDVSINEWVESIGISEQLMDDGREYEVEMANALAELIATRASTYQLECYADAFRRVYEQSEAERQERIAMMKK
jgi:hypothetical protein